MLPGTNTLSLLIRSERGARGNYSLMKEILCSEIKDSREPRPGSGNGDRVGVAKAASGNHI